MNPSTTASLICPACGQAFLSMQQSMAGVAQCPHCAHSGSRAQFGTQAWAAGVAQVRRQVAQTQPLPQPDQTAPQAAAWPGLQSVPAATSMASIARATLQPSQALMPTGAPPPAPAQEYTVPPHLRTSPWKYAVFILAFLAVCAAALWMWWDHANVPAFKAKSIPQNPPAIAKAQPSMPTVAKSILIKAEPPDVAAVAADVKSVVTEIFAASTPEQRAACVHDAEKHQAEIEGLFGPAAAEKIELRLLARIPGLPLTLPGGQMVPLFKLVTSKCSNGALVRLETGADGKRRIHWPLFFETHEARLQQFLQKGGVEDAAWFYVGLRPSHGLDIPAELRPKYLTFDVQVAAGSDPHFVACVERDTPLGRFMDRETEWGKACLARLLVRRLDIQGDAPCMIVVDCEGAVER